MKPTIDLLNTIESKFESGRASMSSMLAAARTSLVHGDRETRALEREVEKLQNKFGIVRV